MSISTKWAYTYVMKTIKIKPFISQEKNMKKNLIALLLICCMIVPSLGVFAEEELDLDQINEMINYIEKYHKYEIEKEELIEGAYKGVVDTLDKHSKYFSKTEYNEFLDYLDGTLIGIGVYIEPLEGFIKVITPIEHSPADQAGIISGDIIIKVNGEDISKYTYEKSIDMIKGEENAPVKITVRRGDEEIDFDIIRKVINTPDVTSEMLEDNIGYLRIIQFGNSVADEVDKEIKKLQEAGMTSIIIDLRNNPGGYLNQVVKIADWFVEKYDPIVHVDYKAISDENYYAKKAALNIPTMVLINAGTASASEILAGAIQNNNEGKIIGETSYGKGTVQNLITLNSGSAIKLTTAEYLTAGKVVINNIGIIPDYEISIKTKEELELIETFVPMIEDDIAHFGKKGLDIYGAQQRLEFLGYDVDVTGIFDLKMSKALEAFQISNNLKDKYGIYPETKEALEQAISSYYDEDPQLEKAKQLILNK